MVMILNFELSFGFMMWLCYNSYVNLISYMGEIKNFHYLSSKFDIEMLIFKVICFAMLHFTSQIIACKMFHLN